MPTGGDNYGWQTTYPYEYTPNFDGTAGDTEAYTFTLEDLTQTWNTATFTVNGFQPPTHQHNEPAFDIGEIINIEGEGDFTILYIVEEFSSYTYLMREVDERPWKFNDCKGYEWGREDPIEDGMSIRIFHGATIPEELLNAEW